MTKKAMIVACGFVVITVCAVLAITPNARGQESEEARRSSAPVIYEKQGDYSRDHMTIVRSSERPERQDELEKLVSPLGTMAAFVDRPDFTVEGPWHTSVYLSRVEGSSTGVTIRFEQHGNGGVKTRWLNEKLIWLQVWWGRIASTDLIFDVETETFVYAEDANYAALIQPRE